MRDSKGRFVKGYRTSPETEFKKGQHWRKKNPHWDKSWLMKYYYEKQLSAAKIAKIADCTENNIFYWMDKHGIKRRSISESISLVDGWGLKGEKNGMYGRIGEDNPNYKDGSSPERQKLYARGKGTEFIKQALKKDNYKCQRCGNEQSTDNPLHVHHIKPWAGNPEYRFDLENVIVLCRNCHRWVHSKKNKCKIYLYG